MIINVDVNTKLELINENHTQQIFDLVDSNRDHLREWLSFVDRMQHVDFTKNFVNGTMQRNKEEMEYAFVIIYNNHAVGRMGVYKIDGQNKIGEIGYWLAKSMEGKGIATKSTQAMIDFCFSELKLNRIEIKCAVGNIKSRRIPEKLNFTKEGVIRQGERLYDKYVDLELYSLLKQESK
jgi:ribosomal-protein-serine acetyltransferase